MQLPAAQDGARINPAENDSNSQNEAESKTFHNELNEKLSARVSTPEMYDVKLMGDKDRRIQELEELVKQGGWVNNNTTKIIFLPSKLLCRSIKLQYE